VGIIFSQDFLLPFLFFKDNRIFLPITFFAQRKNPEKALVFP
jgi:hypothetical protein